MTPVRRRPYCSFHARSPVLFMNEINPTTTIHMTSSNLPRRFLSIVCLYTSHGTTTTDPGNSAPTGSRSSVFACSSWLEIRNLEARCGNKASQPTSLDMTSVVDRIRGDLGLWLRIEHPYSRPRIIQRHLRRFAIWPVVVEKDHTVLSCTAMDRLGRPFFGPPVDQCVRTRQGLRK